MPDDNAQGRHRRRRSRPRLMAALALGVVALVGTKGTWAHWTDSVAIGGTTFTSGTIDLTVNGQDTVSGFTALNLTGMVPGSSTAAVLTVKNTGTVPLMYTATSTASDGDGKGLGAALLVKVTGNATVTGSAGSATCAGSALPGAGTGLGGSLLGTGRQLAAGASESICVQVSLPTNALSALQGATTDVGLTFTGTSDLS